MGGLYEFVCCWAVITSKGKWDGDGVKGRGGGKEKGVGCWGDEGRVMIMFMSIEVMRVWTMG